MLIRARRHPGRPPTMHRTTRPLRRHLALAVVACTALVGAGCSGDEDANGDTTTTVEDVTGSLTAAFGSFFTRR